MDYVQAGLIMSRNMGLPLHLCHCCGLIETSLAVGKFYICSACQEFCHAPYETARCMVLAAATYGGKLTPTAEP